MWSSNTITTIDIWSSKIRTIIWYFDKENNNDFHILGIWIANSNAIRKWNILDMEEFKNNLDSSLEEAEKMAWEQVSWAFISFNISGFEVIKNKWIISVSGSEVTEDDIDRALEKATTWVEIQNKEILKVIPESFAKRIYSSFVRSELSSARIRSMPFPSFTAVFICSLPESSRPAFIHNPSNLYIGSFISYFFLYRVIYITRYRPFQRTLQSMRIKGFLKTFTAVTDISPTTWFFPCTV